MSHSLNKDRAVVDPEIPRYRIDDYYKNNRVYCNLIPIISGVMALVALTLEYDLRTTDMTGPKVPYVSITPPEPPHRQDTKLKADTLIRRDAGKIKYSNRFQGSFQKIFEPYRQALISKYQPYFDDQAIEPALFDEFMYEFSRLIETSLEQTRRELGQHSLSDEEIQSKVQSNEAKLKGLLESARQQVEASGTPLRSLSEFISKEITHSDAQSSLNGIFNMEGKVVGNCVTRSIIATRTLLSLGIQPALALMPTHIAAVVQKGEKTFVVDTYFYSKPTADVGDVHTGGQILAALLAVDKDRKHTLKLNKQGRGTVTYQGLSPTGKLSNLETPEVEYEKMLRQNQDRQFLAELDKKWNSRHKDEIYSNILASVALINNLELREQVFSKLLFVASDQPAYESYEQQKREIISTFADSIRSQLSDRFEINITEALEKSALLAQFESLHAISNQKPLTVTSNSYTQNKMFQLLDDMDVNLSIIIKPKTLKGLQGNFYWLDVRDLWSLEELLPSNHDANLDDQRGTDNDDRNESSHLESEITQVDAGQLEKLSKLDLRSSGNIFGIEKPLTTDQLSLLHGFSGRINFAFDPNVNLSTLKQIDLSKTHLMLDFRNLIHELITKPLRAIELRNLPEIQYLVEHNLTAQLQVETLVIQLDPQNKEMAEYLKSPKCTQALELLNVKIISP